MKTRKARKSAFADALVRTRKERGCPSAYGFFHNNGGRKRFEFTYHYYLLIEQGARLPSAKSLGTILELLGLKGVAHRDSRKQLLQLYLRELAEGDPLFDLVFEEKGEGQRTQAPSFGAPGPGTSEALLHSTARTRVSDIPRMSAAQYEATNSSPAALWSFQYLLQSGTATTASELAGRLNLPEPEVAFALSVLCEQKLVVKKKDRYSSRHFETDLFAPVSGMSPARAEWVGEQILKKTQFGADDYFYPHFFMVLEDRAQLALLGQMFNETMRRAYLMRPTRPVTKGTLVSVEARVGTLARVARER